MPQTVSPIEFGHVWKIYRMDAGHDSLRDAIPALVKRLIGRNGHQPAREGFWALRDVTFQVKKGETLGIIGPNGAGKSTILKLLSRISRQTKGVLRVRGRMAALIELGGGFHGDLSGEENIYLQGTMLGLSRKRITQLYGSIAEFSELGEFLAMPVKRYSSGMIVRLGFAIAAHINPDVLLLDEVLAVGDLSFQQKSFQRILELKQQGTTMIFISHDLGAVEKLCDRVLLLEKGAVVDEGMPSEVIQRYRQRVHRGTGHQAPAPFESSGALTIRGVRLTDASGQEAETIEVGHGMRVEIDFAAARPIRRPDVQVWIERGDDLLCHATSLHQAGSAPEAIEGEGTIALDYGAVNLLPNSYVINLDIYEDTVLVPLASAHKCRTFQTTSSTSCSGVVDLEHRWAITGKRG
ncbi:MAG: ABC transporter ATP-binding protein [Candidatus Omnitrophica bacterium]|nr:ABC transporter ATP-binding protein [Candidatus Omnitrophota bacterium]